MAPICRPKAFGRHPSRSGWWRGKDSNLRRRKPADLQSAPVGRLGTPPQNEPRILRSKSCTVNDKQPCGRGISVQVVKSGGAAYGVLRPCARPSGFGLTLSYDIYILRYVLQYIER